MNERKFMFTDNKDYVQAVLSYVTKPIDDIRARQFVRPIDAFRREKVDTSKEAGDKIDSWDKYTFEFVERVSRWIPANPSKAEIVAQHDATYFALRARPQSKSETEIVWANIYENGAFGLDNIIKNNSYVALVGQRVPVKLHLPISGYRSEIKIWKRILQLGLGQMLQKY